MDDWNELRTKMMLDKEKKQFLKEFAEAQGNDKKWHAVYTRYLKSNLWKSICVRIKPSASGRCEYCHHPFAQSELSLHHKTYDRVGGNERDSDIIVACRLCHEKLDKLRDRKTDEKREEAYVDSKRENWLDRWATKIFGMDWDETQDPDHVEEEFKRHLYKDKFLPARGHSLLNSYEDFEEEYDNGNFFIDPLYQHDWY